MRKYTADRHPRGLAAITHGVRIAAVVVMAAAGCNSAASPPAEGDDGTGGDEGGPAGTGGKHATGGSGGHTTAGSGGSVGSGGKETSAQGGSPSGGAPGGTGGSESSGGSSGEDAAAPPDIDAAPVDGGGAACGMTTQACCAGNTCTSGTPSMSGGTPGAGMTVLELKASGKDPYAYFASKDLLPIDGPASGFITDDGDYFTFVMHQDGAEETVSSGAQRQRNELTVNPGNPAMYKGMHGDTMSYTWRFRLDKMNANPTWCDIFQVKQHGTLGPAPFMALEANKGDLTVDTQRLGVVARVPLSTILGVWINASVTAKYSETGSLQLLLKKDDGTTVISYKNDNINLWGAGLDFVRPKWGFYRNKATGAGEALIHYNDMKIIRGTIGVEPTCTCK